MHCAHCDPVSVRVSILLAIIRLVCDEPLKQIVAYGEIKSTNLKRVLSICPTNTHAYTLFLIVRFDWKIVSTVYYRIATLSCSWLRYLLSNPSFDAIYFSILFSLKNNYILLSRFKNVVRIMMLDLRYYMTSLITLVLFGICTIHQQNTLYIHI